MRTSTALLCTALTLSASAQLLQPGMIAPDFTATDINGVEHHLYDYLDQGYTVYIDFNATWCAPCWQLHQSGVVEGLYEQYGPGTAEDKVKVFMIEVDATTDLADMHGTGDNTQGDWVTGTPYPIIDSAPVGDLYGVVSFPLLYTICPNRTITQYAAFPIPTVPQLWSRAQTCTADHAVSEHEVGLREKYTNATCFGAIPDAHVTLLNFGSVPLEHASIETTVSMFGSQQVLSVDTVHWSGALAPYSEETVAIAQVALPLGIYATASRLLEEDAWPANNNVTGTALTSTTTAGPTVQLEMLTHAYGEEVHWTLIDRATPNVPVYQGTVGSYAANTLYTEEMELDPNACYTFNISYGTTEPFMDPAYWRLSSSGEVFANMTPSFTMSDAVGFQAGLSVGIDEAPATAMLVPAPNPMDDHTQVDAGWLQGTGQLIIRDAAGRTVRQERIVGGSTVRVERGSLRSGCYLISVSGAEGQRSARLLVQ